MTIAELGSLGELLAAIATIVTLIYLALQLRQNTAALRTASRQAIVAGMRDHGRLALEPGAESFLSATLAYPEITPEEYRYYSMRMHDLLLFFQGAHALYEAGTLEEETYQAYLDFVAASFSTPGGARFWQDIKDIYTARMVVALDDRIARGNLRDLTALRPQTESPTA